MPSIETTNQEWLKDELADVSLGDVRLDWRLRDTGSKLAAQPSASINQACDDWADTRASYRLFENEKTTADKIQLPHYRRSGERAASQETVFAIQDTSYLDYTHHPATQGLGPIGTKQQDMQGFVMHSTLLMTGTATPLGLIDQSLWVRPEAAKQMSAEQRRRLPIEEKESYKWLSALTHTVKRMPDGPRLVTIGDSEADIFELFAHAQLLETDLLVRAGQNRSVCEPEIGLLWDTLKAQPVQGRIEVSVPARNQQPARVARLTVRFTSVKLPPPQHLDKNLEPVEFDAVLVWEEQPPAGVEAPIQWLLLTTVPVSSLADAIERIEWYRLRWQIEVYHKVLKSGCRVEQAQLATKERLLPYIALCSIIAFRLFWMTMVARHDPDAPATVVLADHEWQALYAFHHKTNVLPEQPPSVAQVTTWIAQLGGFLARKSDGFPGVTVIWRGWQRLSDITSSWLVFHSYPLVGKG